MMRELQILSATMGIGRKSVDLGIAFVKRSVFALEVKQKGLKFAERAAFNGRANF